MKRFILCSLSATLAVAAGSAVHAQSGGNTLAQMNSSDVQCTGEGPYHRGEEFRFEYRSRSLVGGVLSPDDLGPNNRAVPTTGLGSYAPGQYPGGMGANCYTPGNFEAERYDPSSGTQSQPSNPDGVDMNNQQDGGDYPTEGTILSPDDGDLEPNNRDVPNQGPSNPSSNDGMNMNNQMDGGSYPTEGTILSPDDGDLEPNNRDVPGQP